MPTPNMMSIVHYCGISECQHCGYCNSTKRSKAKIAVESASYDHNKDDSKEECNSVTFGLFARFLTLNSFNQLLDLGWSRSGKYLYKPLMEKTCCPQYTIRLDVHKFRLSRTQKRVLRAMKNYLLFDIKPKEKCVVKTENYGSINKNNNQIKKLKQINKRINSQPNECVTKKKYLRRLKAEERLKLKGVDLEKYKKERAEKETSRIKTLQSYLEYLSVEKMENEWKHRLKVTLVGQPSPQFDKDFNEEFNIFKRYQIEIHKDDPNELSTNSFTRFLASSPLINEEEKDEKQRHLIPLGSYHQQYRLDGRIIAVGVIDILPNCFSSKYLFYDPDYSFLSLGVFSALFEINFTKQLALQRPNLHYYYMGFYLYDCPKMRYKECFRPSDLLCDYCYDWVPITECNRLLEENNGRFTTFHPNIEKSKKEEPTEQQLSQVQCLTDNILINFGNLRATLEANGDYEELEEITEKVRNFAYYAGLASSQIVLML